MMRVDQTRQNDVARGINDLGAFGGDVRLDRTLASIVTMVPPLKRMRAVSDMV